MFDGPVPLALVLRVSHVSFYLKTFRYNGAELIKGNSRDAMSNKERKKNL